MNAFDESDGVYAKRRRNLMMVSVLIIILSVAKPIISKITLFGIEFKFEGYEWGIWLGLTLWFIYATIRVYTFYNKYKKYDVLAEKYRYIYWEGIGQHYWPVYLGNWLKKQTEIEKEKALESGRKVHSIAYSFTAIEELKQLIESGLIPGSPILPFILKYRESSAMLKEEMYLEVEFNPNSEKAREFDQRQSEYRYNDDWWEYTFLAIFAGVSSVALIIGWIRVFGVF